MKTYTVKHLVLAYLLGVLTVVGVVRWYALERSAYITEMRVSYIEGYLEKASGGR